MDSFYFFFSIFFQFPLPPIFFLNIFSQYTKLSIIIDSLNSSRWFPSSFMAGGINFVLKVQVKSKITEFLHRPQPTQLGSQTLLFAVRRGAQTDDNWSNFRKSKLLFIIAFISSKTTTMWRSSLIKASKFEERETRETPLRFLTTMCSQDLITALEPGIDIVFWGLQTFF